MGKTIAGISLTNKKAVHAAQNSGSARWGCVSMNINGKFAEVNLVEH